MKKMWNPLEHWNTKKMNNKTAQQSEFFTLLILYWTIFELCNDLATRQKIRHKNAIIQV